MSIFLTEVSVLDDALLEIDINNLQEYKRVTIERAENKDIPGSCEYLIHELCHGWECKAEQIRLKDFGLSTEDIHTNLFRELWVIGASCGLATKHNLLGFNNIEDWLKILPNTRDFIFVWNPKYVNYYKEEFFKGYNIALEQGIEGCVASWKDKLKYVAPQLEGPK